MDVDDTAYYSAMLAAPDLGRYRLQAVCRIIVPGPQGSRLDFLTSQRGSLGDRSPLQMLSDDSDFKSLQQAAAAWAAEWSRTAVKMYEGLHDTEPTDVEPLYTAVAVIDPRKSSLERASEALQLHGMNSLSGRTLTLEISLSSSRVKQLSAPCQHRKLDDEEAGTSVCSCRLFTV